MRGQKELKKHENGERLTLKQMILAKCCECMGKYIDGRSDCFIPECPLYPKMPYGAMRKRIKSPDNAFMGSTEAKRG